MPFDPTKPADHAPDSSAEMRAQLNALKALIDAVPAVTAATVSVFPVLGSGATPSGSVTLNAGVLHFDFGLVAGPPGEVTQAQLSNDLSNAVNQAMLTTLPQTSANSNAVALLSGTVSDPPTQAEVQAQQDKINELLNALRR